MQFFKKYTCSAVGWRCRSDHGHGGENEDTILTFVMEITGFVLPPWRKRGLFSLLEKEHPPAGCKYTAFWTVTKQSSSPPSSKWWTCFLWGIEMVPSLITSWYVRGLGMPFGTGAPEECPLEAAWTYTEQALQTQATHSVSSIPQTVHDKDKSQPASLTHRVAEGPWDVTQT